ncbi:MAG: PGL/p-HBAD biosynthesis glycosyltransferase [Candidatus Moanabacter tarae]|uniref:PGL/p-HBAD biosynthesis glycosyltransferase n=1 Tax=Candidatus Moanibacter tarae TaxID=2200854 RepID=A0A2Z4ALR1_9BACT|nr:MAG: PGL/p-HBAD biosynthesis glycosyltransferase [Candidatus Moanabacter tarae]|tara:strand:+ start:3871 stop:4611 length:741 start_codon:yes stop_codon:yes gene_type:complete
MIQVFHPSEENELVDSKLNYADNTGAKRLSLVSIVIPVFNEAILLPHTLDSIDASPGEKEVIVVDGGSLDGTREYAEQRGAMLISSPVLNRAQQMNLGAKAAKGDVLLFLHADTLLPQTALQEIQKVLLEHRIVGGAFSRHYDHPSLFLRTTCFLAKIRSRLLGWYLGDQGIFVRTCVFKEIRGFRHIENFEDLEFSRSLRSFGHTVTLNSCTLSSGRRFGQYPILRTLKDVILTLKYLRQNKSTR